MPKDLVDVDAFTSPITVPVDGDPRNALSVEVPFQALADRTRHVFSRFDGNGEIDLPAPLSWIGYVGAGALQLETLNNADFLPARGALDVRRNFGLAWWDLSRLPRHASIVRVRVLLNPGVARAGTNRMKVELQRDNYGVSFAKPISVTTTVVGSVFDDGTTDLQWVTIDLSGSPVAVSAGAQWSLEVAAGNDAATNNDRIRAALVELQSSKLSNL